MVSDTPDTNELLDRVSRGDAAARHDLLARHRDRLRRMIAVRLDPRLAARFDASDVVQEALLDAAQKLPEYLEKRPVAFYPWLRRLAWERLVKLHERHVQARKRSVTREEFCHNLLPDESVLQLAQRLVTSGTSPSERLVRSELCARVRQALAQLDETDREVLVLRYLEQLATSEVSAVLGISQGAVKMRHRRALERLARFLEQESGGSPS